ncbi:MAG: hypothetical protein K5871_08860 [Lachnospiraceae bacterium]|nr:hypothetical protein [Lachnospiraceae bacterium]
MKAKTEYERFFKLESAGDHMGAWATLLSVMYCDDETSKAVFEEICDVNWVDKHFSYFDITNRDHQMIFASLAEDAIEKDGPQCALVCHILDKDCNWYGSGNLPTNERLLEKYPDHMAFRLAMENKAKQLGYV